MRAAGEQSRKQIRDNGNRFRLFPTQYSLNFGWVKSVRANASSHTHIRVLSHKSISYVWKHLHKMLKHALPAARTYTYTHRCYICMSMSINHLWEFVISILFVVVGGDGDGGGGGASAPICSYSIGCYSFRTGIRCAPELGDGRPNPSHSIIIDHYRTSSNLKRIKSKIEEFNAIYVRA